MKFNKIVCVDNTKIKEETITDLQNFSKDKVLVYKDYPESREEVIRRIGNAEAVLVSWHTEIDKEVIQRCENIKYIGMACSLYDDESANVAVEYARSKGIQVTGIKDYGDPGVPEFIISELIQLFNGYKGKQWKELPVEINSVSIGIIGLGVTGKLLADCLLPFKPDIYYYNRTRKPDYEKKGIRYLPLSKLLKQCEIVSFHLPKKVNLMGEREFKEFGNGKILINTSLGLPFSEKSFRNWILEKKNFAILDGDGKKELDKELEDAEGMITTEKSAGWSSQTLTRLSEKVFENLRKYCKDN